MRQGSAAVVAQARYGNDQDLLVRVLRPYKSHCKYLKSFVVTVDGNGVSGHGELEIRESCYIDDTGHLNAVEVNICFNQMLYCLIARAVQENLAPVFSRWSMDDYWARQLPAVLIARYQSVFRRPINARRFFGEIEFSRIIERKLGSAGESMISIDSKFRYWDESGGHCEGTVRVAIPHG